MNKSSKKPVKYTSSELSELERLRLENRHPAVCSWRNHYRNISAS
ncbi:hypothetical protein [Lactobacillus kimbladii]